MPTIESVFWITLGTIIYALVGYPLLTLVLAMIVRKQVNKQPITPCVSFLIAAYNEEKVIAEKIKQTLELDYPREQLEIIVVSDGSTDRTDQIVASFQDHGVRLHRGEKQGKTGALNEAVKTATGEILIFSDATGVYSRQAVREIVANFNDPTVGCVTGRVAYRYGEGMTSKGFKGYQKFAVAVRRAESRFGSQTSVSGSIHALRRSLYRRSDPAFSLDVIDAVHTVVQNYRVVYEDQAVSWEESRNNWKDEFRCRVRMSVRGTSMIPYIIAKLVWAKKFGYAFQMVSHKILRWWLWAMLVILFIANSMLVCKSLVYATFMGAQVLFYVTALVGLVAGKNQIRLPVVSSVFFFVLANTAMAVGSFKALWGRRMPSWEPVR